MDLYSADNKNMYNPGISIHCNLELREMLFGDFSSWTCSPHILKYYKNLVIQLMELTELILLHLSI